MQYLEKEDADTLYTISTWRKQDQELHFSKTCPETSTYFTICLRKGVTALHISKRMPLFLYIKASIRKPLVRNYRRSQYIKATKAEQRSLSRTVTKRIKNKNLSSSAKKTTTWTERLSLLLTPNLSIALHRRYVLATHAASFSFCRNIGIICNRFRRIPGNSF